MSLTFKLLSLVIRTAAKPIGNYIKRQAREHEGFRKFAVNQAQRVHRVDMRMRLGILHDADAQQRMHEREQRAADEKKRKSESPTVRTAEEQAKYDEQKAKEEQDAKDGVVKKEESAKPLKTKIRPLSEARAIELGANFFSEAFIFGVAVGLLVWDSWRSRRKESTRRDDVADRLEQLEIEVEALRSELDPDLETLHEISDKIKAAKLQKRSSSWNPLTWGRAAEDTAIMEEIHDYNAKQPEPEKAIVAEHKSAKTIAAEKAVDDARAEDVAEKRRIDAQEARARLAEKNRKAEEAKKKKMDEDALAQRTADEAKAPARLDSVVAASKER
ncbi:unnamed protein product [Zymoseptoria tritici ST99CH_1A5]|uniref:OPA3-like protein n=4 Tax=Zymoseptoria tritici TaxID=1047171 RepID=F9XC38_ZYMTI|nr:uncharacterized protein MYCGRDRAFT_72526 [Zymoseptoria tritici IPO323]EGP87304.1 hypothetical protein MYCGRDRAFT_72526 [Zymoseptoria tritici IPO323]SMQ51175.1 unnamed protein product [Zymoseptoria tritici ST99CH_3D7]SMR53079.1 unnamed protein product [Zymoseptoria tritici ST99CH_1E4]SMY24821.1 unnamed protein product [Zymoseptoria tritici ST99CH_1A5]